MYLEEGFGTDCVLRFGPGLLCVGISYYAGFSGGVAPGFCRTVAVGEGFLFCDRIDCSLCLHEEYREVRVA